MPIEVEAGGQIFEFPDGTSQEVMKAALAKRFGPPQAPAQVNNEGVITTSPQALVAAQQGQEALDPVTKRGLIAPVIETQSGQTSLGVPAVVAGPLNAISKLMEKGYQPGQQDEEGARNAAAAALAVIGLGKAPGGMTAAPTARELELAAAERLGTTLPRSTAAPGVAAVTSKMPGGGAVANAADNALARLDAKVKEVFEGNLEIAGAGHTTGGGAAPLTSWLAGKDIPNGASGTLTRLRKQDLANALGMESSKLTPGTAASRLVTMAETQGSKSVEGLMQAKQVLGKETWEKLQPGLVYKVGDNGETFSIRTAAESVQKMTPAGRDLLFGSKGPVREVMDDLGVLAPKIKALESQAGSGTWTGTVLGLMGSHVALAGDASLPGLALAGGWGLNRLLATPSTAPATAGLIKALVKSADNPAAARGVLEVQGLMLSHALAKETGKPRDEIYKELQSQLSFEQGA